MEALIAAAWLIKSLASGDWFNLQCLAPLPGGGGGGAKISDPLMMRLVSPGDKSTLRDFQKVTSLI